MRHSNFTFTASIYSILFMLSFSGVMLIYGSRLSGISGFDSADFALKQFCIAAIGFGCMECLRRIDCSKLSAWSPKLFFAALILLWMLLFCGVKINGMRGWYSLHFFYLQPSYIFKFIYILYISNLYIKNENKERAFLIAGTASAFWIGAIILQPDYGTALIYGMIFAVISFLAGVKLYILALLPLCAFTSLIVFIGRKAYGFNRLYGFFSENADIAGAAWHWKQFQLAIARGGWLGNKIDGAFWSNNYLPFSYNDSAYAALHEMTGYIGAIFILLLFFALFYLFYRRAQRSGTEKLIIISGISAVLLQLLLHCSVNCALIPTTGLTMPLISYGGSSLLGVFLNFGMLLSFANKENSEKEQ